MSIDPVILLVSDLRENEKRLIAECKSQASSYCPDRALLTAKLLDRIRMLHDDLQKVAPTSAIGAGELIRIAVQRLPPSHEGYGGHLREIADRLGAGQRRHADLLWIRALSEALTAGPPDESGARAAVLLNLAVRGASQPVVIHRAVMPKSAAAPGRHREETLLAPFDETTRKDSTPPRR